MPDASGVPGEEELSALPATELAARLAEGYRLIGELTARNERLAERIGQLERQAGKDSSTSSRPPSSDSPYKKKGRDRSLRERGKRRPGERLTTAYETGDVNALVSLLSEDVTITAPLAGGQYVGTAVARRLFETVFPPGRTYRLIPTRANGQPAFGVYVRDPATGVFHVNGMLVVTLAGDRVRAMTRFDNTPIARFGLPRRLSQPHTEPPGTG